MLAFGELLNSLDDRGVVLVHPLLLTDAEQARDDEVDANACRKRNVEHKEDKRHVLLHLLHLLVRGGGRRVAVRYLPDRHVLEADGYQHKERVGENVDHVRLVRAH
jgi:hypothetical protein